MKSRILIIIFMLNGFQSKSKAENLELTNHSTKYKQDMQMAIDENHYMGNSDNFVKDVDDNKLDSFNSTQGDYDGYYDLFPRNALSVTTELSWTNEGQNGWRNYYPACGGPQQSPIDIRIDSSLVMRNVPCLQWVNYNNAHTPLILNNNGHSIEATVAWNPMMTPTLSGGPLSGQYLIHSIHWHWGSTNAKGAEHTTSATGSPIEMHLVHYNKKFTTISQAISSGEADALAVVGVLFRVSTNTNPGMTTLINAIQAATSSGTQAGIALPLGNLGLGFQNGFYTYPGSLTTPPCYPIVRWIVLRRLLPITFEQLSVLRSVMVNGAPLVNNYREPQPNYERNVYYYESCGV